MYIYKQLLHTELKFFSSLKIFSSLRLQSNNFKSTILSIIILLLLSFMKIHNPYIYSKKVQLPCLSWKQEAKNLTYLGSSFPLPSSSLCFPPSPSSFCLTPGNGEPRGPAAKLGILQLCVGMSLLEFKNLIAIKHMLDFLSMIIYKH